MLSSFGWKWLKLLLNRQQKAEGDALRVLSDDLGHYRSVLEVRCVDAAGEEIPWYAYSAIEYIDSYDLNGVRVLEYGSGHSSVFYAKRGAMVTAIEHSQGWYDEVSKTLARSAGFDIHLATEPETYTRRPEVADADIVAIDGIHRRLCAGYVMEEVKAGRAVPALIVLDNSERYPRVLASLDAAMRWPRADFTDFAPINAYRQVTSIYFNPARQISRRRAPAPIGGLGEIAPDDGPL
ncbi:hypothetical protein [Ruegeria arenilitoris]|uniref:hypothetical protein n=1 Tax=Ruegeria arenilitoris TaxID=1173585 RepID=UPI00147AFFB8|nr:hypothetical protein [Ruegeria arenilitoris]